MAAIPADREADRGMEPPWLIVTVPCCGGTVMTIVFQNMPVLQAIGQSGIQFDVRKFNWIGNTTDGPNVINSWHTTGITKFEDVLTKELVVGASGTGSSAYTYPAALKQAAALLHQGKSQEAKAVLETALSTIVVEDIIIPLPLVRAQLALEGARSLLEKKKRTDAESARMRELLATARTQLQLGKALGYATDSEMTDLIASVDELERKTAGSQSAKGLLDPFGPKFDEARRSSQRPR